MGKVIENPIRKVTRRRSTGLVQVARAIAEGKVRITVSDLDRLIRLEEYLREEVEPRHKRIVVVWGGADDETGESQTQNGFEED